MSDKLPDLPMPPEEVINRDMYNGGLQTGTYMAVKPTHLTNKDDLEALAKKQGLGKISRIAVDTFSRGDLPDILIQPLPDGTSQVILNKAALAPTPQFEKDFVDHQIAQKKYIKLDPTLAENYTELAGVARQAGYAKPPLVILDKESPGETPRAKVTEGPDGVPIVIVNSAAHKMTAEYVRSQLPANADLAERFSKMELMAAGEAGMSDRVIRGFAADAAKLGIPTPELIVEMIPEKGGLLIDVPPPKTPNAYAAMTREGHVYVVANAAFLEMPESMQQAVLAHELTHVKKGHITPESMASRTMQTIEAQSKKDEFAADVGAACLRGPELGAALEDIRMKRVREYLESEGVKDPRQAEIDKALSLTDRSKTHPSVGDRKAGLQQVHENPQICAQHGLPMPEKTYIRERE